MQKGSHSKINKMYKFMFFIDKSKKSWVFSPKLFFIFLEKDAKKMLFYSQFIKMLKQLFLTYNPDSFFITG